MTPTRITARLTALFGLLFALVPAAAILCRTNSNPFPLELATIALCSSPYVVLALAAHFGRYPSVKVGSFVVLMATGIFCSVLQSYEDPCPKHCCGFDGVLFIYLPLFQLFASVVSVGFLFALGAWLAHRKQKGADCSGRPQENDASR
jgi:hypothetical protein